MVDWYKTMSDLDRDEGDHGNAIKITSRMVKLILAILILAGLFHALRLWSGSVSWLGIEERSVRAAPGWMHTPLSANTLDDRFGLSLPLFALEGQEIVVQYKLSSAQQNAKAPFARLMVSCFCPASNWHQPRIEQPGSGEIALPVTQTGFYTVKIAQSAGPEGEVSAGIYYLGIRSSRHADGP